MTEIKLFDYQEDMKERIEKALCLHRSVMAQMPTGAGKTVLLASVVEAFLREHPNSSVWIVAHRRELVSQIKDTLNKFLLNFIFSNHPVPLSKEGIFSKTHPSSLTLKGGSTFSPSPSSSGSGDVAGDAIALPEFWYRQRSFRPQGAADECLTQQSCDCLCGVNRLAANAAFDIVPIKAVSIQWLSKHYDEIEEEPGMIVIDEAHHAIADSYQDLFNRNRRALKLGMTATPCRMNKNSFSKLFGSLLTSPCTNDFIMRGYLAPYDYVVGKDFCMDYWTEEATSSYLLNTKAYICGMSIKLK